jgi:hypothetical protein
LIVGGKQIEYFPTYLPTDQIVESERGNKQYFDSGLGNTLYTKTYTQKENDQSL